MINISLKKSDIDALTPNKYGDISLVVGERKTPDEKTKATHTVYVDTYVKSESKAEAVVAAINNPDPDLPF